ncbi:AAA family ATPase [Anaeromicrobium sediminis]|uniref:Nuclease SbcCD subunit C n=1 Tax=Anaeromicrobium sediminis TaxID=1478221 RepID=A0A267MLX0_9FIRM|nr:AAA family ATPase [Anaeromicrobium sediminis]PAB60536.1 hypothetical protein CCE28_03055 [Anaeromicrobium sediminis]
MLLKNLRLKNFKSYEDEVEFNFSTDENKNIILIGGKNGAGKSSIFESIKLCIYGPLAYKYQGFNAFYINKIKSNINNNAFKNDIVTSYVSIDMELEEGSDKNLYTLTRTWTFEDTKLNESFVVYKNNSKTPLNEDELFNFENYLKSILSPKIFDFFFFDGEQLSEFFIGKNSNMHLKESFLSLCNYDTFEVLKNRIINSNKGKSKHTDLIDEYKDNYLSWEMKLQTLKEEESINISRIKILEDKISFLNAERKTLEEEFKKQGGLLSEDRKKLTNRLSECENIRGEVNAKVKNFANNTLPFMILKDNLLEIDTQIKKEIKNESYITTSKTLESSSLGEILPKIFDQYHIDSKGKDMDEISKNIIDSLKEELKPDTYAEDYRPLHQLSHDNFNTVSSRINELTANYEEHKKDIENSYAKYKQADIEVKEINNKLNTSLSNEELNLFLDKITKLNNSISEKEQLKILKEMTISSLKEEMNVVANQIEKSKSLYHNLLKENNVHDVSMEMIELLAKIIVTLTSEKIKEIQTYFMSIFSKIIRKDKFIDYIHIDNDFNVALYIDREYSSTDVLNLLSNIGSNEINKKLGNLFTKDLLKSLDATDIKEAKEKLNNMDNTTSISLRTKVDVGGFSNGEKQIYILCIYWSLVKASGINIPFIIDTPYARIDESHRNSITTDYFSTISNQVVILSTNTEIDEPAYRQLKDIISHEYLIEYDDINRKTNKTNGYFFEV